MSTYGLGDLTNPGWFAGGGGGYGGTTYGVGGKGGGGKAVSGSAGAVSGTGGGGGGYSGDGGSGIIIVAWDDPIIPEPSTALLLALGGALVWRAANRR